MASNDSNEQGNDTAAAFQVGDRVRFAYRSAVDSAVTEAEGVVALVGGNPLSARLTVLMDCGLYETMRPQDAALISRATPASAPATEASTEDWGCDNCGKFGPLSFTLTEPGGKHPLAPHRAIYRLCSEACRDDFAAAMRAPDPQEDSARATPAPARNSFAMTMPCQFGKHGECDGTLRVGNVATPDVVSSPCECECHQHSEPATPAPAATAPAMDTHTLELPVMLPCPHCHGTGTFHGTSLGRCQGCDGDGWSTSTIRLSDEAVDRLAAALAARMRSVAR